MRIGPNTPAVVSGGASGLGAATVRELRNRDAPVVVLDRDDASGSALAKSTGAGFVPVDVTSDDSVDEALARSRELQGVERICVNCAGIAASARTAGTRGAHDMDLFATVVAVNLVGTFRVMAKSAAAMSANDPLPDGDAERGVIVNTASIAAFDGQIGQTAYAASKGGVASLCLPAARDLAHRRIRVMTVAPGIFDTAMLAGLPEAVRDGLAEQVPMPDRLGDPAEFGAMVCFIAETPYMNGETIRLDGALRMGPR